MAKGLGAKMQGDAEKSARNTGFACRTELTPGQILGVPHVVRFVLNPRLNQSKTQPFSSQSNVGNEWVLKSPGVTIMKCFHSLMLPITAFSVLMFPAVLSAASLEPIDSSAVQVQRQEQNGITYLSGGIGEDESKAIQQTTGYNLHMTFSVGAGNEYIPDVSVVIQKAQGQTVLTLNEAGPLVYVKLPAGKYIVVATRNGEERRDTADFSNGAARNLVFHWNGDS